jgi:hypothetical protein
MTSLPARRVARVERDLERFATCPRCGIKPQPDGLGENLSPGRLAVLLLRQGQLGGDQGVTPVALDPDDADTPLGGALAYIAGVVQTTRGGLALPVEDRDRVRAALAAILARADGSP